MEIESSDLTGSVTLDFCDWTDLIYSYCIMRLCGRRVDSLHTTITIPTPSQLFDQICCRYVRTYKLIGRHSHRYL